MVKIKPLSIYVLKQFLTDLFDQNPLPLNNGKGMRIWIPKLAKFMKLHYICNVFFIVLDLRLTMKIGCRDDNHFFFISVA